MQWMRFMHQTKTNKYFCDLTFRVSQIKGEVLRKVDEVLNKKQ